MVDGYDLAVECVEFGRGILRRTGFSQYFACIRCGGVVDISFGRHEGSSLAVGADHTDLAVGTEFGQLAVHLFVDFGDGSHG